MLTTIHSIDTPITDLIFPTVTVCQEPLTPPNPWLYLRPIMEFMHYDCNTSGTCSEIDFLKCNFNFLPSILYRDIDKYANKLRDEEIQILIDPMNLTFALLNNLTNLTYLNSQLLTSFYEYTSPIQLFENKLIFTPWFQVKLTNKTLLKCITSETQTGPIHKAPPTPSPTAH